MTSNRTLSYVQSIKYTTSQKINIINKKLTLINPNGYVAQHLSILGQIEYPQALLVLSRSVPRLVYSVAAVLAEVV